MELINILKKNLKEDAHYICDDLSSLFLQYEKLKIQSNINWENIPKNCPFYEMAPDKYDEYYYCVNALNNVCILIVEKLTTLNLCHTQPQ